MQPNRSRSLLKNRSFITLIFIVVFLVLAYVIYSNSKFHIVSTSKVATISPFINVNYSKPLNPSGLAVSSDPSIIKSFSVSNKTLTIIINGPLKEGELYKISIENARDTAGDVIYKVLSIRPKNIPAQDLPKDQADYLLSQQSNRPRSRNSIVFLGTDNLVKYGVSLAQLDDFKQAVFLFSKNIKTVSIDGSSVKPVPHDPNSSSRSDSINFNILIDNKPYNARVDYFNITALRLYLYDSVSGNIVYDSKDIDLSNS